MIVFSFKKVNWPTKIKIMKGNEWMNEQKKKKNDMEKKLPHVF